MLLLVLVWISCRRTNHNPPKDEENQVRERNLTDLDVETGRIRAQMTGHPQSSRNVTDVDVEMGRMGPKTTGHSQSNRNLTDLEKEIECLRPMKMRYSQNLEVTLY